jgi:Phage integrase family
LLSGCRAWRSTSARKQLRRVAAAASVRRRFAPHQFRHAHAIEMAHKGVPLVAIQRQLGHANLGITSIYLQGIDSSEVIDTVHGRPAPVISATAGRRTDSQSFSDAPALAGRPAAARLALVSAQSRAFSDAAEMLVLLGMRGSGTAARYSVARLRTGSRASAAVVARSASAWALALPDAAW